MKANAKRLLALTLTLVMLLTSIPLTLSVSAGNVNTTGMTADTALTVAPTSSGVFHFPGFDYWVNQDLWLQVNLTERGVLNFNCTKLADASGELDYTYFYLYKAADVMDAISQNTTVDTTLAVWSDYYYYHQNSGNYDFNIPLDQGTYYIHVDSGISYYESRTLNWALNFTATNDYEIEPNNGANMATPMKLNKFIYGYTDRKGDHYSLKVTKDTPIRFYISGYANLKEKVNLTVTYPDGTYKSVYLTDKNLGKSASGTYYYDVLLKKGINDIEVSYASVSVKYGLKPSTTITYPATTIDKITKETNDWDSSLFDADITWKQIDGVDGYQIQRKIGSGSWETIKDASSYYDTLCLSYYKKNTSYQFRIRAYKNFGTIKRYGEWSKIIYVTPTPTNIKLSATSYTYNGKVKTPTVTIKDQAGKTLKKGTDYTVSYSKGRTNVGTYKVTITFKGKYSGKVVKTFKIKAQNVSKCKVSLSTTSYSYDGKVKKPTVIVKNSAGKKLTLNGSYTVTYAKGRKNVGTYKVTIKMKGNYTGTKTVTFKILPRKTSISKVTAGSKKLTVKWAKKTTQVTGYQIQYSTSKSFSSAKSKTITKNSTTSTTLTGLKAKKTYYVRVRTYKTVNGKKVYSLWSTVKKVKTK